MDSLLIPADRPESPDLDVLDEAEVDVTGGTVKAKEPPPAGQQSRSSHIDPTYNLPETLGAAKLSQGRLRLTRIFH